MLSKEENELLTRVGPGTLMGDLMRRYWQPFLYSWEVEPDGPPLRVRLLGEDLIVWRDSEGKLGLIGQACPHRGASLFFGRNEECGLRCVYHGWKFDTSGNCVDMPNEPEESSFKSKIKATSYRVEDWGGAVFAYMGPDQDNAPGLPQFEWALVPEQQRHHEYKGVQHCNWMQALEGDVDTAHLYFLHGRLNPADPPSWGVYHQDKSPKLEITETEYGLLYGARRVEETGDIFWRTTHYVMPHYALFPASEDGLVPLHIYTPVDDEHTLHWGIRWHPTREIENRELLNRSPRTGLGEMKETQTGQPFANWWPAANRDNDFQMDRELQRTKGFTGIPSVRLQDASMTTSMGSIVDRSAEHLGSTDAMIIQTRKKLLNAARALRERGLPPPIADAPQAYKLRSCAAVLPQDVDWRSALSDWHNARTTSLPELAIPSARTYLER